MQSNSLNSILQKMEQRRKNLGVSHRYLAQATGVSLPTVQRIFSGKNRSASFETITKLATVLGLSLTCEPALQETDVLLQAAKRRAYELAVSMEVASATEKVGLSRDGFARIQDKLVLELLRGSRARIWSTT